MLLRQPFGRNSRGCAYPIASGGRARRRLVVGPVKVQASACLRQIRRLETHTGIVCNPALPGTKTMGAAVLAYRGCGEAA